MVNVTVDWPKRITYLTFGGLSSLLCLAAVACVFILKLHKNVMYRLAIYQTFTAMMFGCSLIASFESHSKIMYAIAIYIGIVKVMAALCLTVHLFSLVMFHKNLKRFEMLYIASSLVIPTPIVPVVLFAYDYVVLSAVYSSVLAILFIIGLSSTVVGIALCCRVRRKGEYTLLNDGQLLRQALYEALSFVSYPVAFFILAAASFSVKMWCTYDGQCLDHDPIALAVLYPGWAFVAGLQLLIHIIVVWKYTKVQHRRRHTQLQEEPTLHNTVLTSPSTTYFSIKTEA